MIPCELDITSNSFSDETIITYEIELPPARNKMGLNLLDYEDFTIPCFIDTIPNEPSGNQLMTQANKTFRSMLPMDKIASHPKA